MKRASVRRPCTFIRVREFFPCLFFAKNQTLAVRQAPYSPDMAPCDFWLFPKFKRSFKGKLFQTRENIMIATTAELNTIPKEAFSECFQQWRHRREKWSPKEIILRVIRFPALQVNRIFFFPARRSDTFLTGLVYSIGGKFIRKFRCAAVIHYEPLPANRIFKSRQQVRREGWTIMYSICNV